VNRRNRINLPTADSERQARLDRWHRKARQALQAGAYADVGRACQRLLEIEPHHADAFFIAAVATLESGYPADALSGFEKAAAIDPNRPEYWAQMARCLDTLGRERDALACVDRAAKLPIADSLSFDTLGNVLVRNARYADAADYFERAAHLAPRFAQFQYNLATARMYCGELEAATTAYERVLAIDPDHGRAHLALAEMLEGPPPPGRIETLEAALRRAAGDTDRELVIRQALALSLEAAGDRRAAFAHWRSGKEAKKRALGYTIEEDRAIFSAFESVFDEAACADPRPGEPSNAPIFVLGLPRSGTTLVERILASHSAVTSGGELMHFPVSVRQAGGGRTPQLIEIDGLATALASDPAGIGRAYLDRARTVVGDAARFIDKLPLNFHYVGFLRRALPNARIVCLRRGALDTCLANFRQLFALNFPYYRYSLSLTDTAEYFALFEKLMAHWDRRFPGAIYHLRYEQLVADPESEVRRLLAHLDLDFEPGVLSFHSNEAPVATASTVQVRRPIHQRSVGAWRRYAEELEPLRRRLLELGVDTGEAAGGG
jgi:tetratricopeptide (TPR) repeat protein